MKLIAIFDCDEWKSTDSMRLIAIADKSHLKDVLSRIQKEHKYDEEDMDTYIYTEQFELNEY